MHWIPVPSLATTFRPDRAGVGPLYDVGMILAGSALLAVSAQIAIAVPAVSPVPITGQTFAVLLVGALLGSRRGAAAVLAYLVEGLAGLPVFAAGGAGAAHLAGPTGGYLLGFLVAAWVVGRLAERGWDRRFPATVAAMSVGTLLLFVPGVAWLSVFIGPERALIAGVLPFIPGAIIKIVLAAALLPCGWALLDRAR